MDDAQATRPVPQSLPALPHPTSITAPDSSAYLLINEARRKLEQLEAIKHDVLQGTLGASEELNLPMLTPLAS